MTEEHVEPAGITYDRFRFDHIADKLVRKYQIKTVCEIPAGGEKAMPSIYSLAFGLRGCHVHLIRSRSTSKKAWEKLGIAENVIFDDDNDPVNTGLPDASFDLVWNFATLGKEKQFEAIFKEMTRLSNNLVMTIHYNGRGLGFPWHRLIHKVFGFPWTHGEIKYNFPGNVKQVYQEEGLTVIDMFPLDCPPWPDPPGFRDFHIHRKYGEIPESTTTRWQAPVVDYYLEGEFPWWMKILNFCEELPIPRILKYPFSHLFLVLGQKQ